MQLIKIGLWIVGILFLLTGMGMDGENTGLAGFLVFGLIVAFASVLPKTKKGREEDEIRRLQIEELRRRVSK